MNLSDLAPALKRAVAVPGTFDSTFPLTTDQDLTDTLADAMAEAQLDGFLSKTTLDVPTAVTTPDLEVPEMALVVLYGMSRVLTARVANLKNRTRYRAGNTEAETEQSATVLTELLKEVAARKAQLLADARAGNASAAFVMVDQFVAKSIDARSTDVVYLSNPDFLAAFLTEFGYGRGMGSSD